MIAHLSGTILFRGLKHIILDVNGVGYKLYISLETLKTLGRDGEQVKLYTHLYVRENAMELYGFATMAELEFFELLIGISGIGPKSAIGILSVLPLYTLKKAIASNDTTYLTKVSGIGRRIAEKIVLELKEKLSGGEEIQNSGGESDVLDALIALGYTPREARDAVGRIGENSVTVDEKLKEALKFLGR